jgi:hypothetical protein
MRSSSWQAMLRELVGVGSFNDASTSREMADLQDAARLLVEVATSSPTSHPQAGFARDRLVVSRR